MISLGTYKGKDGEIVNIAINSTKTETEVILFSNNEILSAFKKVGVNKYSYRSNKAELAYKLIEKAFRYSNSKNSAPAPCELGAMTIHNFKRANTEFTVMIHMSSLYGALIKGEQETLNVSYVKDYAFPKGIPYVKLTTEKPKIVDNMSIEDTLNSIPVRTVEEIALEKEDITWLANKKYYVVNDDSIAEELFTFFENYNGKIAYDIESTGLKINCFGKINSSYAKALEEYNKNNPDSQIRVDRLCGIIFCVEPDVSYYFPCFARKFKPLYEDRNSEVRKKIITNVKMRYTIGDKMNEQGDMADYIRNTQPDDIRDDVVLMERVRNILEKCYIITHGGSIEYKTGLMYDIDTNIKDDTMIEHQLFYKFSKGGKPERSNLKYLSKTYLGIDQWSLKDFFPEASDEDDDSTKGKVKGLKKKKKGSLIDFSYMDYNGTRIYAPADGDCTLLLDNKFKPDIVANYSDALYLYSIEMIDLKAVGYVEFYGHRIDEYKIDNVRRTTEIAIGIQESEIRQYVGYSSNEEIAVYNKLKELESSREAIENNIEELTKNGDSKTIIDEEYKKVSAIIDEEMTVLSNIHTIMDTDEENPINLNSPAQVADLFYVKLGIPLKGDKPTVNKKALEGLSKEVDDNGEPKYPVVKMYLNLKKKVTLLTKFFGNLQDFMYPGGYIFSSFGQINTNTGRMSCKNPNCQQYPKDITKIVIPRPGCVMCDADYSQIEYRVLTGMAHNEFLFEMFKNPDSDYHTLMASLMYEVNYEDVTSDMRKAAKSFNFGIPYGMGLGSLAILLTGKNTPETREEAAEKYEMYFKNQPMTRKFFEQTKERAQVLGYTKTVWNRIRKYDFTDADGNINKAKRGAALRQAGNAVIQGSAADIFKISLARNFEYIRANKLFGKMFITNLIHDEQLMEIDVQKLNIMRVLGDIGHNMQFEVPGFPPLYIGAGVGNAWGYAKSGDAEIHPDLLAEYQREGEAQPIFRTDTGYIEPKEVVKYFDNRLIDFRIEKVKRYMEDENNWNKKIHPAYSKIINEYIIPDKKDENGNIIECDKIEEFIKKFELDKKGIYADLFKANDNKLEEDEKEDDYDDEDEEEELENDDKMFSLIDEESKVYGADVRDIIAQFGTCVIKHKRICGIDVRNLSKRRLAVVCDYLEEHVSSEEDTESLQVIFLKNGNVTKNTGIYVKGLNASELETKFKLGSEGLYNGADIENRAVR